VSKGSGTLILKGLGHAPTRLPSVWYLLGNYKGNGREGIAFTSSRQELILPIVPEN
jgi:hypothetical protein